MSDENKDLNDDLNDMIGDAKEGAKKAVEKAEEVIEDAKEATEEFVEEAKETLSDGKNVAIIAHLTLIGWIIAIIMNSGEKKTEFGSFYIRQMLGLIIVLFVASFANIIPLLGQIIYIVVGLAAFIAWIMSLIGALGGQKKVTFLFGKKFQEWFKSL